MKLYAHRYNSIKKTIETRIIEAEEKPKTYIVSHGEGRWKTTTRISKSDINVLKGKYSAEMYTLTPDATPYVNELIKKTELAIDLKLKSVEELKEKAAALRECLHNIKGA